MIASQIHDPHDLLLERAVAAYPRVTRRLVEWAQDVRAADGQPGRWRWALRSTRDANVAATAYILGGLGKLGLRDQVLTDADRREGAAWVNAMYVGNGQYHDPALLDRRAPGWPADRPWPDPAMQNVVNQYARNALSNFTGSKADLPADTPPPGWPQPDDDPATMLEWVKTRPFQQNAWSAGSHAMRMMRYMLTWHSEGRIPLQPLIDALNWTYSIQDPATGLWGSATQARATRINGNFKLYRLLREELDLPMPHAATIIDQVLAEMTEPGYDQRVGGCDEWDNLYVLAMTLPCCPGYRAADIRRLAAWRLNRMLELFPKPDGGWSYHPDRCTTHWTQFDMAPSLPQGDAMGPGMFSSPLAYCIDQLGLADTLGVDATWRQLTPTPPPLRAAILAGLRLPVPA